MSRRLRRAGLLDRRPGYYALRIALNVALLGSYTQALQHLNSGLPGWDSSPCSPARGCLPSQSAYGLVGDNISELVLDQPV